MSQIKVVGLCSLAVLAASAVAAGTALATLPELGRCLPLKNGKFRGGECIALANLGRGKFEWYPGPGEKKKFTVASAGVVKLNKVGKSTLTCKSAASYKNATGETFGEYTGPQKLQGLIVKLSGCKLSNGKACIGIGPSGPGEIFIVPLAGEVGFIKKPSVGLDLFRGESPRIFTIFSCAEPPGPAEEYRVEGSVIAPIAPQDEMTETFKLKYAPLNGVQDPEKFEGGLKDTLTTLLKTPTEEKSSQSPLRGEVVISNGEPLEIKAS